MSVERTIKLHCNGSRFKRTVILIATRPSVFIEIFTKSATKMFTVGSRDSSVFFYRYFFQLTSSSSSYDLTLLYWDTLLTVICVILLSFTHTPQYHYLDMHWVSLGWDNSVLWLTVILLLWLFTLESTPLYINLSVLFWIFLFEIFLILTWICLFWNYFKINLCDCKL